MTGYEGKRALSVNSWSSLRARGGGSPCFSARRSGIRRGKLLISQPLAVMLWSVHSYPIRIQPIRVGLIPLSLGSGEAE